MEVLSTRGAGTTVSLGAEALRGEPGRAVELCQVSARRGRRPGGSWRAGGGAEVLRIARVCVCMCVCVCVWVCTRARVRERGTVGMSEAGRKGRTGFLGLVPFIQQGSGH